MAAWEEAGELIAAAVGVPEALELLTARREQGEPLAWITGRVAFCGIELHVAQGVYVPRAHTEPLARRAAAELAAGHTAVDLCTGAGAVAAVMAAAGARVVATELDPLAADCASTNGVDVLRGSLDESLPAQLEGAVDVLTAVVPYVPTGALGLLARDVLAYEPRMALDGGADGTDLLASVARRSVRWLRPGGLLGLELGGDQAEPVGRLLESLRFRDLEVMCDEEGDARAICARR